MSFFVQSELQNKGLLNEMELAKLRAEIEAENASVETKVKAVMTGTYNK